LRVVLIGQAAFAEKALEVLHARGDSIVHVFAPPDISGGRPDPLKTKALAMGLPLSQPASFKGDTILDQVRALDADLAVMAFVTLIVPERILFAPRLKTICFHPSLLPRHRGASAINWTLIQGDPEAGITWFWPDRGIDTGPILLQRHVPIAPNDTTGSLYFNTLFPLGIETLSDAMRLVESGAPPRLDQDESRASYEAICRDEHARIDFARPAREVHNLIRGCDPQPGAFITMPAGQLRLYDAILQDATADTHPAAATAPGTIIALDSEGLRVALDTATLLVRRVRLEPSPKKIAPTEAGDLLRPGQRL
jgi:methionyl-tRNA formyltransferase